MTAAAHLTASAFAHLCPSPVAYRKSLRYGKAVVKKPSGRWWDTDRNVWVKDPTKQQAQAAAGAPETEAAGAHRHRPKKRPEWASPQVGARLYRAVRAARTASIQDVQAVFQQILDMKLSRAEVEEMSRILGYTPHRSARKTLSALLNNLENEKISQQLADRIINEGVRPHAKIGVDDLGALVRDAIQGEEGKSLPVRPSPVAYRKSLRYGSKAVVQKPSGGWWDTDRNVWVKDPNAIAAAQAAQSGKKPGTAGASGAQRKKKQKRRGAAAEATLEQIQAPVPSDPKKLSRVQKVVAAGVRGAVSAFRAAKAAGKAVGGAYGKAGAAVAAGMHKVADKAAEKINQARGKKAGDKGAVEASDVMTVMMGKLSKIADWFGSDDQAEDVARDQAEQSTGVTGAYAFMKVGFAAVGWALAKMKQAVQIAAGGALGEPEDPSQEPPADPAGGQPPRVTPEREAELLRGLSMPKDYEQAKKMAKEALADHGGDKAKAAAEFDKLAQYWMREAEKTGPATVEGEKLRMRAAEARDAQRMVERAAGGKGLATAGPSPFAYRKSLRYGKAVVKKPSGRWWDTDRNVWVKDPTKQQAQGVQSPGSQQEPGGGKVAKKPKATVEDAERQVRETGGDDLQKIRGRVEEIMGGLSKDGAVALARRLGLKTGLTSKVRAIRRVADMLVERADRKKRSQAFSDGPDGPRPTDTGRTNPKFAGIDQRLSLIESAIGGDDLAAAAIADNLEEQGTPPDRIEHFRRAVEEMGGPEAVARMTADVAASLLVNGDTFPRTMKAQFRKYKELMSVQLGRPAQDGVVLAAMLKDSSAAELKRAGPGLDWDDREQYTFGKLIEGLGYTIRWRGDDAPSPLPEDTQQVFAGDTSEIPNRFRPANVRRGGVALAVHRDTPMIIHTAVKPDPQAFRKLFVRLQQMNWAYGGMAPVPSGEVADMLRQTNPDLTMTEIWGAIRHGLSERFFDYADPVQGTEGNEAAFKPAKGERQDAGVLWGMGLPVQIQFDGREWPSMDSPGGGGPSPQWEDDPPDEAIDLGDDAVVQPQQPPPPPPPAAYTPPPTVPPSPVKKRPPDDDFSPPVGPGGLLF